MADLHTVVTTYGATLISKLDSRNAHFLQLEARAFSPTAILVTGAAGFIASHVCADLVVTYPDCKIIGFDKLDYCSSMKNLDAVIDAPNFEFVKGDIRSADTVNNLFKQYKIDTILHLAAQTHVDNSFGNSMQVSVGGFVCGVSKI